MAAILTLRVGDTTPILSKSELFFNTNLNTLIVGGAGTNTTLLRVGPNTGSVQLNGTLTVSSINVTNEVTIGGNLTLAGNIIKLGDEGSDNIQFVGTISGSLIPGITNIYNIGSPGLRYATIYGTNLDVTNVNNVNITGFITATNTFTSSVNTKFNTLQSYTSSIDSRFNTLATYTGSNDVLNTTQNTRLTSLETYTGSNNTTNTTQNNRLTSIEVKTGSYDSRFTTLGTYTSSVEGRFSTLATYTGSNNITNSFHNDRLNLIEAFTTSIDNKFVFVGLYTSSNDILNSTQNSRLTNLELKTQSLDNANVIRDNRLTTLETSTTVLNSKFDTLSVYTTSVDNRFTILNNYTSSNDSLNTTQNNRLTSIEVKTGSYDSRFITLGIYTSSNDTTNTTQNSRLSSIEVKTGSYDSRFITLGIYTSSVEGRFSTLSSYTSSNDTTNTTQNSRLSSIEVKTGSYDSTIQIQNSRLSSIEVKTGSYDSRFNTLATYTGSNDSLNTAQNNRLTTLETYTGSNNTINTIQNNRLSTLETYTGSLNLTIDSINSYTQSLKTAIDVNGQNLTVYGNLIVQGDTTTLNTSNLVIEDKLIEIAVGSTSSISADGGGLYISGADASIIWNDSLQTISINKRVTSAIGFTGDGTNLTNIQYTNLVLGGSNLISGSQQVTQSLDTRYLKINGNLVVSGSSQINITNTTGYTEFSSSLDSRFDIIEITTSSFNQRINSIEIKTGSYDSRFDTLSNYTGSVEGRFSTLSNYTSSNDILNTNQNNRLSSIEVKTGSYDSRFNTIGVYTSSNDLLNTTQNSRLDSIEIKTGSYDDRFTTLGTYTSSVDGRFSTLSSYTSSNDSLNTTQNNRLSFIEVKTGSYDSRFTTLGTYTSSVESRFSTLSNYTSSNDVLNTAQNNRLTILETYTSSNDILNNTQNSRLSLIEIKTGSYDSRFNTLSTYTSSNDVNITRLFQTASAYQQFSSSINTTIKTKLNLDGIVSGSQNSSTILMSTNSGRISGVVVGGIISGSSQVTQSLDTRYEVSGSVASLIGVNVTSGSLGSAAWYNVSASISDGNRGVLGTAGAIKDYIDEQLVIIGAGDITKVTAGDGISGGAESGEAIITLNTSSLHFTDGVDKRLVGLNDFTGSTGVSLQNINDYTSSLKNVIAVSSSSVSITGSEFTFNQSPVVTYSAIVQKTFGEKTGIENLKPSVYFKVNEFDRLSDGILFNRTNGISTAYSDKNILETYKQNEPRFEYILGENTGLLIETGSINLIETDISPLPTGNNASGSIVTNVLSPRGLFSEVYSSTVTVLNGRNQGNYTISNYVYDHVTFSIFVQKKLDNSRVRLRIENNPNSLSVSEIVVNLTTGVIISQTDSTKSTSTDFGDWIRISVSTLQPATQSDSLYIIQLYPQDSNGVGTVGQRVVYACPQLEPGTIPTSFIPNVSPLPVNRNSDDIRVNLSKINQKTGTIRLRTKTNFDKTLPIFVLNDGTSNNELKLLHDGTLSYTISGSTTTIQTSVNNTDYNTFAISYDETTIWISSNGNNEISLVKSSNFTATNFYFVPNSSYKITHFEWFNQTALNNGLRILSTLDSLYDKLTNSDDFINETNLIETSLDTVQPRALINSDYERVSSEFIFERGGIGTRFNSQGFLETSEINQPRIDFDPTTGECLGLLSEGSAIEYIASNFSTSLTGNNNTNIGITQGGVYLGVQANRFTKINDSIGSMLLQSRVFSPITFTPNHRATLYITRGSFRYIVFHITQSGGTRHGKIFDLDNLTVSNGSGGVGVGNLNGNGLIRKITDLNLYELQLSASVDVLNIVAAGIFFTNSPTSNNNIPLSSSVDILHMSIKTNFSTIVPNTTITSPLARPTDLLNLNINNYNKDRGTISIRTKTNSNHQVNIFTISNGNVNQGIPTGSNFTNFTSSITGIGVNPSITYRVGINRFGEPNSVDRFVFNSAGSTLDDSSRLLIQLNQNIPTGSYNFTFWGKSSNSNNQTLNLEWTGFDTNNNQNLIFTPIWERKEIQFNVTNPTNNIQLYLGTRGTLTPTTADVLLSEPSFRSIQDEIRLTGEGTLYVTNNGITQEIQTKHDVSEYHTYSISYNSSKVSLSKNGSPVAVVNVPNTVNATNFEFTNDTPGASKYISHFYYYPINVSDDELRIISTKKWIINVKNKYNHLDNTNTLLGYNSAPTLSTGSANTIIGRDSGLTLRTGSFNTIIGDDAGRFITNGSNSVTQNSSILLGFDTRPSGDNQTNQIIIGTSGRGLGSNTTVIGNSSTTISRLHGNLLLGSDVNSGELLQVNGTSKFTGTQTITGDISLSGTIIRRITSNGITTGTTQIQTYSTTGTNAGFFEYVVSDGTNLRAGTITSVWNTTSVRYNEVTTNDIGNTNGIDFNLDINAGNVRLNSVVTAGVWTIKILAKIL